MTSIVLKAPLNPNQPTNKKSNLQGEGNQAGVV